MQFMSVAKQQQQQQNNNNCAKTFDSLERILHILHAYTTSE